MKTELELKKLIKSCNNLIEIVEGVSSVRWENADNRVRLKDMPQWCEFYVQMGRANEYAHEHPINP